MGRNPRLAVLVGLGAIAALSFISGLVNLSKGSHPAAEESASRPPSLPVPLEGVTQTVRTARTHYSSWGRNPFTFEEKVSAAPNTNLSLTGVAWDKEKPQAVINGRIVGVGDVVAGHRVVSIKEDRVILNDGVSNVELPLWRKR